MQQGLHDLAAAVRATPAVAERIPTVRSLDELTALEGGMRIRGAIEAFLERHGDVGQAGFDITSPSWSEEPRQLLVELARLVRSQDESPAARRARLLADGDAIAARTRDELRDRPGDLARFEELLAAARACGSLSEEHNYWIDRLCQAHSRRFIRRVGDVLVTMGSIAVPDDIFHLKIADVRAALATGADQRALVAARRRDYERDRRLRPPRYLGAPLAAPVPSSAIRDLGYRVEQTERDVLRGVAASPGTGRGPVRLVSGSADFERFQRGDVLVCRSTTVSWVPLFTMASAIVADIGGALSHAARGPPEFGVPARCGARAALGVLAVGEVVRGERGAGAGRRGRPTEAADAVDERAAHRREQDHRGRLDRERDPAAHRGIGTTREDDGHREECPVQREVRQRDGEVRGAERADREEPWRQRGVGVPRLVAHERGSADDDRRRERDDRSGRQSARARERPRRDGEEQPERDRARDVRAGALARGIALRQRAARGGEREAR